MVRRATVALALLALPAAAWGDVIPSRRARDGAESATVERRLIASGVDAAQAREEASRLSSEEARYFARSPRRVQLAGHGGEFVYVGGCCCGLALLIWLLIVL